MKMGKHGNMRRIVWVIMLIFSVSLTADICALSAEPLPQSITLLYSNNINAEIDPCPV